MYFIYKVLKSVAIQGIFEASENTKYRLLENIQLKTIFKELFVLTFCNAREYKTNQNHNHGLNVDPYKKCE